MASRKLNHRVIIAAGVLGLSLAGCTDAGSEDRAFDNVVEWCAAVADVDERFTEADSSDESFEVKQDRYREINDRLKSLSSSLDLVDADARDSVRNNLDWALSFTQAILDSETEQEAADKLFGENALIVEPRSEDEAGAAWIREQCGVDIDGEG